MRTKYHIKTAFSIAFPKTVAYNFGGRYLMEQTRHFDSLASAVSSLFGSSVKITRTREVSGGDINESCCLTLSEGSRIFMKRNPGKKESFFAAEAEGLSAIASTQTIGTPKVLATGTDQGCPFLLLEFIRENTKIPGFWECFARRLAAMHQAGTEPFTKGGTYGFFRDNYIGASHQCNKAADSWIDFFRECRLTPQLKAAARYFEPEDLKKADRLLDRLESILTEPEYPSLLHGDLWAGNFITGNDGTAWLIDPAVYVGHREADLAMTELFGGFPPAFYDAYRKAAHLQPEYEKRRDLYNLYHLLNHLNLFGSSYLPSVKRVIRYYTG